MWFLPLLVIGAIAAAVASRSKQRGTTSRPKMLPMPTSVGYALPAGAAGVPGPIAMLGEILSVGQAPPPNVILGAIAEAQAIGRHDLASDIVHVFVEPVLRMRIVSQAPTQHERGSCARAPSARYAEDNFAAYACPPAFDAASVEAVAPPTNGGAVSFTAVTPSDVAPQPMQPGADDISALLNSDPARFMEMVSRNGSMPQQAAIVQMPQAPLAQAAPPQGAVVEAVVVTQTPDPGSPIPGVPDAAWQNFVSRISRESPQFASSRHVGQYRQRRERLAELNIDPQSLMGSPQAQRAALDVDLVDAYRHGAASDLFSRHLGRPVAVPGRDGSEAITLSGVLGVIQVAGLEGAVSWLERSNDRKRYPHTTQTFLNTNGVF